MSAFLPATAPPVLEVPGEGRPAGGRQAVIELVDVSVAFGGNVVLDGVSLSFGAEINGLVGPNGAGKTTIFNVVSGYVRPRSGQVLLEGQDIGTLTPAAIGRRGVGRTFQSPKLVPSLTVLDNVLLGAHRTYRTGHLREILGASSARREERANRERSMELLDTFGLARRASSLASSVSLGTQKIVEIARALVGDPAVVLLDEPAAGLSRRDVETMVDGLTTVAGRSDVVVVIIEHDLHLVATLCSRLSVLNFGRIIAEGPPSDVVQNPDVIEAYLGAPRSRARQ